MKFRIGFIIAIVASCLASCKGTEEPLPTISVEKSEYYAAAAGEQVSVTVTSNKSDWTFEIKDTWVKGEKNGSGLKLTVEPNEQYDPRTTTVNLKAGDASASFSLTQAALIFEPQLEVDAEKTVALSDKAQKLSVNVLTNMDSWVFEMAEQDWIKATSSASSIDFEISQNMVEVERSVDVTVYAPDKENYMMQTSFKIVQAEADIQYENTDLSEKATSNCYVITHKGPYSFKATVRGNGKTVEGLKAPSALNPSKAKLVWQTSVGVINSVSLDGGEIHFEAGKKAGNALIAALDASGKIIWSWHIWRPEVELKDVKVEDGSYFQNINLGAVTDDHTVVGCYGLLYQWGRKDPFPGSELMDGGNTSIDNVPVYDIDGKVVDINSTSMYNTRDNSIAFSIANPTVCISNNSQKASCRDWLTPSESNLALWGNPQGSVRNKETYPNKGSKTYYDPCPVGYRVPHVQVYQHMTSLGSMVWAQGESEGVLGWYNLGGEAYFAGYDINQDGLLNMKDWTDGWWIYTNTTDGTYSFFPATSRYDGNYAMLMGSMVGYWGNYWTNAPGLNSDGSDSYMGMAFAFGIYDYGVFDKYSVTASASSNGARADGYAIRCIKE
ncbi:MAG: hypothetical protein MJY84_03200 [Bacteroidales bacterium]|nr:hypothetical protein [Bacteroidales bacterium]